MYTNIDIYNIYIHIHIHINLLDRRLGAQLGGSDSGRFLISRVGIPRSVEEFPLTFRLDDS